MSLNINRIVIDGRLVRDPELNYLESGTPVSKITIAHNKPIVENGEYKTRPMYLDVVLFGKLAENVIANCEKGDIIVVDGELDISYYKQSNLTRKNITIEKVSKASWQKKRKEQKEQNANKKGKRGLAKLKKLED